MQSYDVAKNQFADWGVDTDAALKALSHIPISMHCWQGDDVVGFEKATGSSGGGIQATGNHPGRARTPDELREDASFAFNNIPGSHRFNLHAMYLDTQATPDRDEIEYDHFKSWVEWAKSIGVGLDFNPTMFAHRNSDDNLTLSHPDKGIRDFWIEHGKRSREIAARFGKEQGSACITNFWVPDGYKDVPVDRLAARQRLENSLDSIFEVELEDAHIRDAVESKLFGIGVEACTVGSHEFYLGYAIRNKKLVCLDMGHFHPTESVADKLSSVSLQLDELLLHVSRPMRWDSDHVILLNDDVQAVAQELVMGDLLKRTHIGLDFFDATISRTTAWVVGVRNMQKALLRALLLPKSELQNAEANLDFTKRLLLTEELKDLPYAEIWNEFCYRHDCAHGRSLIKDLGAYQTKVAVRG
ncbi:L-rhamnose isomerase [Maritalea sp.]|uniref:L-rhamnose isomerase n=1 Tax=Maritalea sp. TaxID=2003361 RepID=UPI003EFAC377